MMGPDGQESPFQKDKEMKNQRFFKFFQAELQKEAVRSQGKKQRCLYTNVWEG